MKLSVALILGGAAAAIAAPGHKEPVYQTHDYSSTLDVWGNDCIDVPTNPGYAEVDRAPLRKEEEKWSHIALKWITGKWQSSEEENSGWNRLERAPADHMLRLSIYMGAHGDDKLAKAVRETTRLFRHRNYGHNLTSDEKTALLAPTGKAVLVVHRWLETSGAAVGDIHFSEQNRTMWVDVPLEMAEKMLHAKYHIYEVRPGGCRAVRTRAWKLPWHVWEQVGNYAITPTNNFYDIEFEQRDVERDTTASNSTDGNSTASDSTVGGLTTANLTAENQV